jgi:hypothetical protein
MGTIGFKTGHNWHYEKGTIGMMKKAQVAVQKGHKWQ